MTRECSVCHTNFKSSNGKTICDECFKRILHNMEHPQTGICPVCESTLPVNKRRKYCSERCGVIAHSVTIRK